MAKARRDFFFEGGPIAREGRKAFPGANKKDKRGVLRFVWNKFVNRTGILVESFEPPVFHESAIFGLYGRSPKARDLTIRVNSKVGKTESKLKWSGRSGLILGVSRNKIGKGRIAPVERSFAWVKRSIAKALKAGLKTSFNQSGYKYV
jgi:hypothetical protein